MTTHLSLGYMIGGSALILLTVIFIGWTALWVLSRDSEAWFAILLGGFVYAIFGGLLAFALYPYGPSWHTYYPTKGTVSKVGHRLIADGKAMSQRYVVQFADGRERGCDDTRCALVEPGDTLTLYCEREWQYAANPGWGCNFVSDRHER